MTNNWPGKFCQVEQTVNKMVRYVANSLLLLLLLSNIILSIICLEKKLCQAEQKVNSNGMVYSKL